jgi:hypothetical protein
MASTSYSVMQPIPGMRAQAGSEERDRLGHSGNRAAPRFLTENGERPYFLRRSSWLLPTGRTRIYGRRIL